MRLVVAYRGKDKLVQTGMRDDHGMMVPVGYVEMDGGDTISSDNLLMILKRGYWEQFREFDFGDANGA